MNWVFLVLILYQSVNVTGKRFMRCGKISVEGEAEENAVSPRPRFCQKHVKKSNPYSSRGLDKFETVYAELSAKREYVAKKIGVSEDQVRFSFSKDGWTPVVVRTRDGTGKRSSGEGVAGVSIPGSREKKNGKLGGNDERNGKSESISITAFDARNHSLVMPCSRFLRTTAFGLFGLSAMWARRSAVPSALTLAAAMAVSGVMCMKTFIWGGVSIFAAFFRNLRNPKSIQNGGAVEAIAEQKDVDMGSRTGNPKTTGGIEEIAKQKDVEMGSRSRNPKSTQNAGGSGEIAEKKDVDMVSRKIPRADHLTTVSAPCSPMRGRVQPTEFSAMASPRAVKLKEVSHEHKHHHNHNNSKTKKIRRIVSMDSRPIRSVRPQGPDIFYRKSRPAMTYDASVGATSLIVMLFGLAFFGRLYAIFFTSAWWYLLPMFRKPSESMNTNNSNSKVVDHQSSENRKKVIIHGLLGRRQN